MPVRYISVCAGIEAASVATKPLGWEPIAFSEIEPFPCAVLAHHYPEVPNLGDMTKFREWPEEVFADCDVLVGGPPCQAFSVAGLRKGISDPRGALTLCYVQLLNHIDEVRAAHGKPPCVALYENVPGLLSDKDNAFGNFLAALVGEDEPLLPAGPRWTDAGCVLGPTRAAAWRILDAQYFGVAQRRRRVFVVVSARAGGVDPIEVLLVEPGVRRDPPTRGEAQQDAAADPRGSTAGGGGDRAGHAGGRDGGVAQAYPELPHVVGTLSDGAHNGGGLNGQDAYTGRILPVCALPGAAGGSVVPSAPGREGSGLGHEAGSRDPRAGRWGFL